MNQLRLFVTTTVLLGASGLIGTARADLFTVAGHLWIQYRDANCAAERDLYASSTAASPDYQACLEAMTRARTKELTVTYAVKLK